MLDWLCSPDVVGQGRVHRDFLGDPRFEHVFGVILAGGGEKASTTGPGSGEMGGWAANRIHSHPQEAQSLMYAA